MEKLTAYLESEKTGQRRGADLLEEIYRNCFECEALNTELMNEKYRSIYEKTRHLPIRAEEELLDAVNDGFAAVERTAFCEGFRMGLRLALEGAGVLGCPRREDMCNCAEEWGKRVESSENDT